MASNESKTLWVAVLALLAFAAMMAWMLAGSGEVAEDELPTAAAAPSEPVATTASAPKAAATKPAAAVEKPAAPAAIDPLVDVFAGPMPDFMVDIHTRVLDKKPLGVEQQKALYNFGQENKTDARPQLLLAWDSMNREWDGIAVRMYRIAYRADNRAKHDPRMLNDLISVASRLEKTEHREATAIITEAYGESVLPRLDDEIDALRESGQHARSARLERVRDAVKKAATQ
jgi:hypothetical protein